MHSIINGSLHIISNDKYIAKNEIEEQINIPKLEIFIYLKKNDTKTASPIDNKIPKNFISFNIGFNVLRKTMNCIILTSASATKVPTAAPAAPY